MNGRGYPGNVWASEGTPIDMLRVQYRHMRSGEARANTSTDWWEINVRACLPRAWRVGADGSAQGVSFATLDTLGDVIASHLDKWVRRDLELVIDGDLFELDAVNITATRTTTSYVEVRMDFPRGTTPWDIRQLIVASAYEVCRRVARYWVQDQLTLAIEEADTEVMNATQNLMRAKRYGSRVPNLIAHQWLRQTAWLIEDAEQRLATARQAVTRLESLEAPLSSEDALWYWEARERRDDKDAAPIAAMIRRYAVRQANRYLLN